MAKGRRVRRIIRKIDTWSVFRVAALFYLSVGIVFLLAGVLLWIGGSAAGAVGNVEGFMQAVGLDDFRFVPGALFRGAVLLMLLGVALATGFTVLMAVLYNLISDVVGGVELNVLEEAPVAASATAKLEPVAPDADARDPKLHDRLLQQPA